MQIITKIIKKLLRQANIDMEQSKHIYKEIRLPDTWPTKESINREFVAFESNKRIFLRPLNDRRGLFADDY